MMDYEVFKNVAAARIKEFLPSVYAEFDVKIIKVPKINGMREAMVMDFESDGCRMSGPNIYMDTLYNEFSECGDLDSVLKQTAEIISDCTGTQVFGKDDRLKMKELRGFVVQMLINTEMNRELLETAPHREFLDLSLIYRLAIPEPDGRGFATALINNELMEELGVTADELDRLAEENSRRDLPAQLFHIGKELAMMTTEPKMYGAINLLRLDEIQKAAEMMEGNLYILPSSVHDLMLFKDNDCRDEARYFEMLKSGNDQCNDVDENLSYNIYFYDREKNELQIKYHD